MTPLELEELFELEELLELEALEVLLDVDELLELDELPPPDDPAPHPNNSEVIHSVAIGASRRDCMRFSNGNYCYGVARPMAVCAAPVHDQTRRIGHLLKAALVRLIIRILPATGSRCCASGISPQQLLPAGAGHSLVARPPPSI